jgi:hypothetical protein
LDDQADILAQRDELLADIDLIRESVKFETDQNEIDVLLENLANKKL